MCNVYVMYIVLNLVVGVRTVTGARCFASVESRLFCSFGVGVGLTYLYILNILSHNCNTKS